MGENNKIAPPNRFVQLKTFSCNHQFEKPRTLFLKKSLVLGRKWFFFGGGKVFRVPQKWFWHNSMFSNNTRSEKQNV
jgi:hypothetical protein